MKRTTYPVIAAYWPAGLRRTSRMRTGRAGGRSSAPPLRTHCRPGGNTPAGQAGTAEAKTGLGPGPGVEPWLLTLPPEGGCRKTEGDCWDDAGGSWCDDWAAAAAAAADDDEEDLGGCCCRGAHCRGDYCRFGGALARGLALGRRSHCRATIGGAWCGWPGRKGRSLRGSWRAGCLCRTRCWFLSRLLSPADETGPRVNSQDLLFLLRLLKTSWNEEGSRQMWINNTWGEKNIISSMYVSAWVTQTDDNNSHDPTLLLSSPSWNHIVCI